MESSDLKTKKTIKNLILVIFADMLTLLSGIMMGFIVPKIMSVADYGYYKTFTLYVGYIGIFHFGFLDGIYFIYAGTKYSDIDKSKFNYLLKFTIALEGAISFIGIISSFFIPNIIFRAILILVSLNLFAVNVTTYYEYLVKITMRYKQLSFRSIIRTSLNVISIFTLFILYKFNVYSSTYLVLCVITVSINMALLLWYILSYRELLLVKRIEDYRVKKDALPYFKIGVPLLITNLVLQLVFMVDQQVVNILFSTEDYSIYAFAYSMLNLITVATNSISTVIFPMIKKMNIDDIKSHYSLINSYLLMFVSLCLLSYYPLCFIVDNFLIKYHESLYILRIIIPGVLISSSIGVIKYNFYKKVEKIRDYLIKSVIILVLAIISDIIVYYIFGTMSSISVVSIVVLFAWYLLVELFFIRKFNVLWIKNMIFMSLVIVLFYAITIINNIYLSGSIYFVVCIIIILVFYRKELYSLLKKIKGENNI